jgi:hypothetical protein
VIDTPFAPAARLGLRAALFVGAILAVIQLSGAVRPVDLLAPGRDGQGAAVMVHDFGVGAVPDRIPFDGQYIYVTARLLPDWDAINDQIYESSYRSVRILHPLLASPAGSGTPLVLALELWNLVGVGLLTAGLADLLARHGHRPGLALLAPVACALSMILTTSEPLAFGLAVLGLAMVDRNRLWWGAGLLALGGLTRESAVTVAVAAALVLWTAGRRRAAPAVLAAAVAPLVAWWLYVQSTTPPSRVPLTPFGFVNIGDRWWVDIVATGMALALIAISVVAWWDVPPLRWLTLGFAAWLPLYEEFAFKLVGLPRLSLVSMALGLAGLARWRTARRERAPEQQEHTLGHAG